MVSYPKWVNYLTSRQNRKTPLLTGKGSVHRLPPVCSSSCPPAQCRGRRAAGPCTARTAACAAPTAPAVQPCPPPGWPAGLGGRGYKMAEGSRQSCCPPSDRKAAQGLLILLLTFGPFPWFAEGEEKHLLVCVSQVARNHANPEEHICLLLNIKADGPVLTYWRINLLPHCHQWL